MQEALVVGTAETCHLRVDDAPYMSNRHFAVIRVDGAMGCVDLGSTNGTEVFTPGIGWARAYAPIRIGPGSKIWAGRMLFKIGADGEVTAVKDVSVLERDRA